MEGFWGPKIPLLFSRTRLRAPAWSSSWAAAMPPAPAPQNTMRMSSSFLPTTFMALIRAPTTSMAVPSWSSQKTGMSSMRSSFLRMVKVFGEEMSSRFIPPKFGAIMETMWMNSSGFSLLTQRGMAFTSPKSLNSRHLPSIMGIPARGPTFPMPQMALPSETTAKRFPLPVYS